MAGMATPDHPHPNRGGTAYRMSAVWQAVEAWMAVLMGSLLAALVVLIGLLAFGGNWAINAGWLPFAMMFCGLAVVLEGPFLVRLWVTVWRGEHRVGPMLAARQRRYPLILAVPVAGWWALHFAAAVLMVSAVEAGAMNGPGPRAAGEQGILVLIAVLFAYAASVAANVYLLLAVNALLPRGRVVGWVWRNRFWIDLVPAAITAAVVILR